MKISVLGCGRWGSFQAWYAARCGHDVMVWGRAGVADIEELMRTRTNAYLTLPDSVRLTTDLDEAVEHSDFIIISISSQALRELAARLDEYDLSGKSFLLCMKGLEQDTGKRLSVVMRECIEQPVGLAVLAGPGQSRATRPASRALRSWIRKTPTSSATSWMCWAATSSGFTSAPT